MEEKKFKIKGRVFDKQTNSPLNGVKILISYGEILNTPISKPNGTFEIEIKVKQELISELLILTYTKSGYVPTTQSIINRDKTIKTDLNTIGLINIDIAAQQATSELQNEIDSKKQEANSLYLNGIENLIIIRRKSIMKVISTIKTRLIPLALGLLITFGITKLSQKSNKICPSPEQLKSNISKRNKIVRQLNQIYSTLILNTTLASVFIIISNSLRNARLTVDNLPFPLATPPGIGVPYSLVGKLQNINDLLEKLEKDNKDLNKQILIALVFLSASLIIILSLLKGIDDLTQECSKEQNIPYEEISKELLSLTQETEEENSDINLTNSINGFILGVETSKNTVGSLERRYAVAKNNQGISLLKGEPSFSSSDQILIDELAFYIKQNDLKAY